MDEGALRRAWESSQRSTKEDWAEWMRHFAVELLRESPSPALRATYPLAQVRFQIADEAFKLVYSFGVGTVLHTSPKASHDGSCLPRLPRLCVLLDGAGHGGQQICTIKSVLSMCTS